MKKTVIALLAACSVSAHTASANEVGFYIGGYFGQASKDVPNTPYVNLTAAVQAFALFAPTDERISFDDSDTSYAVMGGYRLNKYLAFETSFTQLGSVTYKSSATGDFPLEPGSLVTTLETETSGFAISVLGTLPLTRNWELFARAGALFATNKLSISLDAQGDEFIPPTGNRLSDSFSQSSTDTYAGVGITRRFLEIYDVRLEYQRVFDAGLELTGGQGDLDAALLGLTVTF